MEFIPLEGTDDKKRKRGGKKPSLVNEKTSTNLNRFQRKGNALKKVKNKYNQTMLEKRTAKVTARKSRKKAKMEESAMEQDDDDDDDDDDEDEEKVSDGDDNEEEDDESEGNEEEVTGSHDEGSDEGSDDEEAEEEEEDEEEKREKAKLEKWRQQDEKKKNRLFVKMKKKIMSEGDVKALHPDIRGVIFPRKKNSRWCWAVFASEERANEAFPKLAKIKEIYVSRPNPRAQVEVKREKKMLTIKRKKNATKKMLSMWT